MINCTNLKCKYMSGENKCNCKNIILSYWNVATRNMGNKDFLECKSFKIDKESSFEPSLTHIISISLYV